MSDPQVLSSPHHSGATGAHKLSKEQYSTLLKDILLKIQKTVPSKKNKELIEVCKQAQEQVDKDNELKADKYFYILKMGLETGLPRLMTDILICIQKLYTYDCLIGDSQDNCVYPPDRKPSPKNGRLPRLLIDAIADSVMDCAQDSDNQVQLQVIKILLTIVIAVNSKVHEITLLSTLRTQYSIYMTSTSTTNQKTAKAASTQMINTVFSKMDAFYKHGTNQNPLDLRKVEARLTNATLEKSLIKKNEESKDDVSSEKGRTSQSSQSAAVEVAFNPMDLYIHGVVRNMVDNVCLYEARIEEIKKLHATEDIPTARSDDQKQQQIALDEKIAKVPLNPIPSGKKSSPDVCLTNELGFEVGRFGWCISCRNAANLWCKDTKHPVCSEDCKKKHFYEASAIDKPSGSESAPNFSKGKEANLALTDAHLVFRSIVKLAIGDAQNGQLNRFAIKTKLIGLELIHTVLSQPKQALLTRREFIDVIKNVLCDGLLRYSVSTELVIFQLVIDIFYCLFLNFRQHLKQIIRVFIETIFLKLLDSSNSSYNHKNHILWVFDKISQNTSMLLEIFVNYDCDMSQKDLTERIVESLCKIANGRFAKSEHQSLISQQEAVQLRDYATRILVQILRSFNGTIDAKIAESKISQRISQSQVFQNAEDSNPTVTDASEVPVPAHSSADLGQDKKSQLGDIQSQRNAKQVMSQAALKFNFKPKNGINFLVAQNLITKADQDFDQHVKDVVKFVKTTPVLDKTMIGVFLGTDDKLPKACLYQFIDEFDLKGVHYVQSLKTILQGFRLPGEGQVVDRVMEKFGLKFIEDNPNGTDGCQGQMTAECVYLLSYATMMMQTSLHNPNAVKSRMTMDDFAKMIKGINGGQNLEPEFIKKVYETVEREPFTLNEDDEARFKAEAATATTFKRKQELFAKESMSIFERGKNQMAGSNNLPYIQVDDAGPIRPMFENTWSANLATLSMILEESTDEAISNLCIEGFILSIKICGFFNMKTERDAFVSSFAKFTLVSSERRLKPKNVACIQSLMNLATYQGNYLGESWVFVLDCVSRLEEMINMGSGQAQDRDFFDTQQSSHRMPNKSAISQTATGKQTREQNMAANSEIIVQSISIEQIDQIFQNSLNLDEDAIIHFIDSLCKNSKTELRDSANPRKFSLQALVEIADLNMVRIRFVWSKLWEMLSSHFVWVGSHANLMVAIFAIDSLRQLADKFLKREEFMSFNFQKDFLHPFEQIMLNNMHTRSDIKDYIVTCITSICATKTIYIKSGWEVIINIFTLAAQDTEQQLVLQSFEALKIAITKHFDLLQANFIGLVNCLNKYCLNSKFQQQAIQAQDLMLVCAEKLQDSKLIDWFVQKQGQVLYQRNVENMERYAPVYGLAAQKDAETKVAGSAKNTAPQGETKAHASEAEIKLAVQKGLWFPLLQNVSNLVIDKQPEKQTRAMQNLFAIMERATLSNSFLFWREVFSQVMYPVLEDIQLAVENQEGAQDDANVAFYQKTLESIVERFASFLNEFYKQLPNVVPVYVDIICLFVANIRNKRLAQVIATSLVNLVQIIGDKLSTDEWDHFTSSLCLCFEATLPKQLLTDQPGNLEHQFTRCLIQLQLINCVKDTFTKHQEQFTNENVRQILTCLQVSHQFAKEFNENVEVRKTLWKQGFMKDMQTLPGLIAQEYKSLATCIQIRFMMMFRVEAEEGIQDRDCDELLQLCVSVMNDYQLKTRELLTTQKSNMTRDQQEADIHSDELEKQIKNLTPIISQQVLGNLYKLQDASLRKRVKDLCPVAIELTLCPDQDVRQSNKELLSRMFSMLI